MKRTVDGKLWNVSVVRYKKRKTKEKRVALNKKEKRPLGEEYAAFLKEVREYPELKKLGDHVIETRCTQKGEMIFELKNEDFVIAQIFDEIIRCLRV